MSRRFRLFLAQMNPVMGDIEGNAAQIRDLWEAGREAGADMVAVPEMALTGYQPQDLVRKPAFVAHATAALDRLVEGLDEGPALGVGLPVWPPGCEKPFNAYIVAQNGRVLAENLKHHLPNYKVFDEKRYFEAGPISGPYSVNGVRIGTPICEDAWYEDVPETQAETGAEILVVPNGSPYFRGKQDVRYNVVVARVVETGLPLAYLNLVGGQDDQIFDGASFVINPGGALACHLPSFETATEMVEFEERQDGWRARPGRKAPQPEDHAADYQAMVLGTRDYMHKAGFERALLGLSGGIDSAIVAAIATDALGPENVHCVMLPSEYTSPTSLEDAAAVAHNLGCHLDEVPISGPRAAVTDALAHLFAGSEPDITEENIQSRLRGLLLMAISNKFGAMLLTTGNKSEVAVGYATIYGDMSGGYNPVKDLYKTRLFETCRWRNANHVDWFKGPAGEVIPPRVIDKPPTAELREDQKDEDSLPPYPVLDDILERLIDHEQSVAEVVAAGHDRETVKQVERLIYLSEYKRFQSAPGARLSQRAFWLDRRYPIVNRWRDPS
ncbi:NAD+ synthase [Jannaschia aquimarina]|uniref:Glutamine-dependent NAD(+) synthetase n=1 Tax=Jannaschia aquimarina TaxID=935700 RepID=A0A0D1D318_9RHOB|nr:NAD+ synthase [Jannaschia aquimarina]KIT14508.1 Glutamine-dependent NAD(+) synthetase [Jannaschia aquimarina]SNT28388.1 NAD+ synthase [Jannaschia aquimarina]